VESSIVISGIVFVCVFGAALITLFGKRWLPEDHLSKESKQIVKLAMGLIGTLAALVLGLLIASAKGTSDTQSSAIKALAGKIIHLDGVLQRYGPETKELREKLKLGIVDTLDRITPDDRDKRPPVPAEARSAMDHVFDGITGLSPQYEKQPPLKARALDLLADIEQTRIRLIANQDSSIPTPFLIILICWLTILFAGYGLLAPRNSTVLVFLIVCTLSVSAAIFLMLELDTPFSGVLQVSRAPLHEALEALGK
jgi:hypothetical protein